MPGRHNADSADAAISVDNPFSARQAGVFYRFTIKPFRLYRIDLIKGTGGNAEQTAAKSILNFSRSIQYLLLLSQHETGTIGIDIVQDGGDGGSCHEQPQP